MRLRVLIVEDSAEDAALVLRHLKKGGYEPVHLVVSTGREMRKALRERSWEVILCDYSLPSFDAFAALKILKQSAVDLPLIVVSGSIDQDTAVATMKAGAHDYLLKDNLTRLVPAIRREIEEARVRQSRRIAESELAAVKEELALQLSDMTCLHQLSVRLSTARELQQVKNEIVMGIRTLVSADDAVLRLSGDPFEETSVDTPTQSIPLCSRSGELLGRVDCCRKGPRGLTEREQRLVELYTRQAGEVLDNVRLYEKAQEANRLKDEFVAMVSHELRTPLTPILGAAHMIRSARDESIVDQAVQMIERNVKTQAQIIEDLLDVSRIVSGKLRLRLAYLDVRNVIESAVAAVRPSAEAKDILLELALQDVDGVVLGDPDRLQQIVWNLLSNAVKFTPNGGQIRVELASKANMVEISVSDTGIGIRKEFLPYVFDRFRQADGSTTRAHGGLGLGLSIVRQLVELHGGTVEARSRGTGRGASFIIRFPMRAQKPARSA